MRADAPDELPIAAPPRAALSVGIAFVAALLVRALHLAAIGDTPLYGAPHGDGRVYLEWADRIRENGVLEGDRVFYQAPLYPYLLAALRGVLGDGLMAIRGAQVLLGAGTAALVAACGARVFGARAGLGAGLLVALSPTSIWLDGLIQKSALAGFLVAASLWAATVASGPARFGLGTLLGLWMLTRGEARLAAAGLLVLLLVRGERRGAVLAAAGIALALAPALARNVAVAGEWTVTTSQSGTNAFIGNAPGSRGIYAPLMAGRGDARVESEDAARLARESLGAGGPLTGGDVSGYWWGRTLDAAVEDPVAAVGRIARKGHLALASVEAADTDSLAHARDDSWALWAPLPFGLMLALAVLGLSSATATERRRAAPWLVVAACQWAALVLFYVSARYRLPLTLALAPLAGAGLARIPSALGARGPLGLPAAAWALAAAALSWAPLHGDLVGEGHAASLANEAVALLESGRPGDAEAVAREAGRMDPDAFAAHRVLGHVLMEQGRSADAIEPLEAALAQAPDDWQLGAWLGIAHGEAGSRERALELLASRGLERPEALPIVSNAVGLAVEAGRERLAAQLIEARLAAVPGAETARFRLQLAWILATAADPALHDGRRAVRLAEGLGEAPAVLEVRAAALARAGDFPAARAVLARALASADPRARGRLGAQDAGYARGEPWQLRPPKAAEGR